MPNSQAIADKAVKHNETAWDLAVDSQDRWTVPCSPEDIEKARHGDINIVLSPSKAVPKQWLGDLTDKKILALAGGGGQQGPLLAAAGGQVTILDLSPKQLAQDRLVAERENLALTTIQGRANDLSAIESESIDLIVNPCSSCFFPELAPVWSECARVLKANGQLMTGFSNPIAYCFDFEKANRGEFTMKYPLPFNDYDSFTQEERVRFMRPQSPVEFSHSLTEQIGGLIAKGFAVDGFYEDDWKGQESIDRFFPQFICVKATKNP